MGIAGACANYFFDEFASVTLAALRRLLTCADGQNIGPEAVELAHADPGDPRQLALVVRRGLGDRHERLVGEDAERGLPTALRLYRPPLPQPLVEAFVHVGGAVLTTHQ